jgi:hypothetical protein
MAKMDWEAQFVEFFREAVERDFFQESTLERLRAILAPLRDPLLDVIGIVKNGRLTQNIDDELYGKSPR